MREREREEGGRAEKGTRRNAYDILQATIFIIWFIFFSILVSIFLVLSPPLYPYVTFSIHREWESTVFPYKCFNLPSTVFVWVFFCDFSESNSIHSEYLSNRPFSIEVEIRFNFPVFWLGGLHFGWMLIPFDLINPNKKKNYSTCCRKWVRQPERNKRTPKCATETKKCIADSCRMVSHCWSLVFE